MRVFSSFLLTLLIYFFVLVFLVESSNWRSNIQNTQIFISEVDNNFSRGLIIRSAVGNRSAVDYTWKPRSLYGVVRCDYTNHVISVRKALLKAIPLLNWQPWKGVKTINFNVDFDWKLRIKAQAWSPCIKWMTDFAKIKGVSSGISMLKSWWTKRMFRISTRSKNLRILWLEKIGFEGDLGVLKVISLNAYFCNV